MTASYTRDPRRMFWYGLTVLFILIGIAVVVGAIFYQHNFYYTFTGWIALVWNIVGVLIGLFFLFLFIWVILWFARSVRWISRFPRFTGQDWGWWDCDGAMEILRERYAKGEITKEQFERMMEDLKRKGDR
ncbi:MAG: SHOCT domain-containing protein [Candidatus Parvarchaeota archaeon]